MPAVDTAQDREVAILAAEPFEDGVPTQYPAP
jgi:hypothetical protein